jgi:hypothetical protein
MPVARRIAQISGEICDICGNMRDAPQYFSIGCVFFAIPDASARFILRR